MYCVCVFLVVFFVILLFFFGPAGRARAGVTGGSGQHVVAQEDSVQSSKCRRLAIKSVAQAEGVEVITRAGRT